MKRNPPTTVIPRVDESKSSPRTIERKREPKGNQTQWFKQGFSVSFVELFKAAGNFVDGGAGGI
ncbi:hypothetical protein E6H34_08905 [Candidatus Bathyarchaeota archaeon]|nr:MAG: hypothetical protein E6H34_08905 [Candidatus Bathyarchaeota archaeon]